MAGPTWARIGQALTSRPTSRPRVNVAIWSSLAAVVLLIVVGAASSGSTSHHTAASHSTSDTTSQPATTSNDAPSTGSQASSAATTPGPLDTTGGVTVNAAGAVLPDPNRTPGALNPAVTQANIESTICVSGWTATVRPPSTYTTALKERQLATGYAYHGDMSTADYEEDHLISLEIGGSPRSELNLWPEPYNTTDGARVKDVVENKLHELVCARTITLASAQHAIATNWWTAYLTYVGTPTPTPHSTTAAAPPPPATTAPPVTSLTCSASMSDPSPAQNSTTDVIVHTAAGAAVSAIAHYKTTNTTNYGTASASGVADIPFRISRATIGYTVEVDVTVSAGSASSSCSTSFTPQ